MNILKSKHPILYLITDSKLFSTEKKFFHALKLAVDAGIDVIQLREKHLPTNKLYEFACKIKTITKNTKTKLIINDRVDIALASDADGVHLGWQSLPIEKVGMLIGKKKIIGVSAHSIKEIYEMNKKDINYVIISPIFPTPSKKDLLSPLGIPILKKAVSISNHPIIALGGINENNLHEIILTGVNGAGFIRCVLQAKNVLKQTEKLGKIKN